MLKKLKWKDHAVLGNLELNFTKEDGSLYSTIVLAGENGTGKTTILETISEFLNLGSMLPFECIEYNVEIVDDSGNVEIVELFDTPSERADMGFHHRTDKRNNDKRIISLNRNNSPELIEDDILDIRHYGCLYSKARSGFNTKRITSVKTEQLDIEKHESDTEDDFTSIKQLLVDLDCQDNSQWAMISKNNLGASYKEYEPKAKMYRFTQAFNNFFSYLTFEGISHTDIDEKSVIFTKNNRKVNIDKLSTGEKQIVFRGTHLLKNKNLINGGIVLIDEPELSLHPKWQTKILDYYLGLFKNGDAQAAQIVIATHSEYVLNSALSNQKDILVIVLSEEDGNIVPKNITSPAVLPIITQAETKYLAFGIYSIDYHIELYGYLQNKNNDLSVKECDEFITKNPLYDTTKHKKESSFKNRNGRTTDYYTLPTYIRNAIDHPKPNRQFTFKELQCSIELLIELCK